MNGFKTEYPKFFQQAAGFDPFAYQEDFAKADNLPALVDVPTGLGKTAMAVVGWLWRRFEANDELRRRTPRRLVYCLPMRVLVEQTHKNAIDWVRKLNLQEKVSVHVLMGGEDEEDWDTYPEREAIIIGTQDMLLSRALNRGYAASRARWPMQFGLLHTDCLWVFDEIQLMGSGLATTAQLEAFRRVLGNADGHACRSVWMSATLRREWLNTVDLRPFLNDFRELRFDFSRESTAHGLADDARKVLSDRWNASKPLLIAEARMGDLPALAAELLDVHRRKPGTRTIVVLNTVQRARELHRQISQRWGSRNDQGLVLLHSRFRPGDRKAAVDRALVPPPAEGTIVVSTQVIEAGVDVSAATLFTELAPWASLVQRFGRCNRRGGENKHAAVYWIDLTHKKDLDLAQPYERRDLEYARAQLQVLKDVGLSNLPSTELPFEHTHVIRRRDLVDLFDTTPDLAGNDIDIDRFVREVEESDVRVFWRAWDRPKGHEAPPTNAPAPTPEELCPAPVRGFSNFAQKHRGQIWRWNFLDGKWEKPDTARVVPGQVFLIHSEAGGYSTQAGWNPSSPDEVVPVQTVTKNGERPQDATANDSLSHASVLQTIAEHTRDVCEEIAAILTDLQVLEGPALVLAARWHDRGKAHDEFQAALPDGVADAVNFWAKAPGQWKRYKRRHFRHELASALAVLERPDDPLHTLRDLSDGDLDLVAYLVAAHHGKVRLSIRSLPNELRPDGNRRFARGVWEGDTLRAVDLGDGVIAPAVRLSLEPMELGLCEHPPFAQQPSWAERVIRLRETLGPFRLAYLEALVRAADMRASKAKQERGGANRAETTRCEGAHHA